MIINKLTMRNISNLEQNIIVAVKGKLNLTLQITDNTNS